MFDRAELVGRTRHVAGLNRILSLGGVQCITEMLKVLVDFAAQVNQGQIKLIYPQGACRH